MGERFHSLRFLTGKSQGNELAIPDPSALVVGRSGNAGVILLDGMVSRTHARFSLNAGSMTVEDLGSANGTFVNGQKIRTLVSLKPGDRILLGATILKLSSAAVSAGTEPTIEVTEEVPAREPGDLSGDLSEVSVVKLLETYALATSDVFLDLRFDGVAGFIAVYRGRIWDCGLDSLPAAPPLKTLLRMLNAARGEYYVRPGGPPESRRASPMSELRWSCHAPSSRRWSLSMRQTSPSCSCPTTLAAWSESSISRGSPMSKPCADFSG